MLIAALLEKRNLPTITNHQHAPGTVLGTGSRKLRRWCPYPYEVYILAQPKSEQQEATAWFKALSASYLKTVFL